jgi:hypothetical protein
VRVKILGAEHPDEEEATKVVESLIEDPIPNVKGTLVNLLGLRLGVRFVDVNMSFAYAQANPDSDKYEERRATEILSEIEADNPDALVTLHNPGVGNVRFAVIDPRRGVTREVLGMLREFGIRYLIASDSGVVAHRSNSVLIEIPKRDIRVNGVGFVRQFVNDLANHPVLPTAQAMDFKWFTYSKVRGGGLHKDDIHPDELSQVDRDSTIEFEQTPRIIEERLKSTEPLYLTSRARKPNQAGYWSELVVAIEVPDCSHWPS